MSNPNPQTLAPPPHTRRSAEELAEILATTDGVWKEDDAGLYHGPESEDMHGAIEHAGRVAK